MEINAAVEIGADASLSVKVDGITLGLNETTLNVSVAQQNTVNAEIASPNITVDITGAMDVSYIGKEVFAIEPFTGDGATVKFDLGNVFRSGSLWVFLNGVLQRKDVSYTEAVDKQSFTFTTAPKNGWKLEARYVVN